MANAAPVKPAPSNPSTDPCLASPSSSYIFASVEQKVQERHRALESAALAAVAAARRAFDSDEDDSNEAEGAAGKEEGAVEGEKKVKQKKPKIVEIGQSYEAQPDIHLMRFADYFTRSFAVMVASQFPWAKMFKDYRSCGTPGGPASRSRSFREGGSWLVARQHPIGHGVEGSSVFSCWPLFLLPCVDPASGQQNEAVDFLVQVYVTAKDDVRVLLEDAESFFHLDDSFCAVHLARVAGIGATAEEVDGRVGIRGGREGAAPRSGEGGCRGGRGNRRGGRQ
ncbi:hypothetical protein Taro_003175, partial [Colocasia esculenta]|nr:hypothetical protein [Colocasia esculenta]